MSCLGISFIVTSANEDKADKKCMRIIWASIYSVVSLRENIVSFAVALPYGAFFLMLLISVVLDILKVVHTVQDDFTLAVPGLLIIIVLGHRVRNSSGYVEFLAEVAGRKGMKKRDSLADIVPIFRAHMKGIARVADYSTMRCFNALVQLSQRRRSGISNEVLAYRQLAYAIELDLVRKCQAPSSFDVREPFRRYLDKYQSHFEGKEPTGAEWADFIVDLFEKLPDEIKAQAASRKTFSFSERVEAHLGLWNLIASFIAALAVLIALVK